MNSTSSKWTQKSWSEKNQIEKGVTVIICAGMLSTGAVLVLNETGVIGGSTEPASASSYVVDSTESVSADAVGGVAESPYSQAEIASQSAESAYISTLSNSGINYNRSTLIELGEVACESLTIATGQGLSKSAAKLGLSQQYASEGSITQKEAIGIVSAAATTFCPQHAGGY